MNKENRVASFYGYYLENRVTVAYRHLDDEYYEVAVAFCNPKDNPNRKLARLIVENRMKAGISFTIEKKMVAESSLFYTIAHKLSLINIARNKYNREKKIPAWFLSLAHQMTIMVEMVEQKETDE